MEEENKNFTMDIRETCYLCGCDTPFYKDTPINERFNYIEGAGQLCQHCHDHCEALRFYTSPN